MMLSDVRDYINSLNIADHVYMGKLDAKKERSVGVYHSRHSHAYKTAIGGPALESGPLEQIPKGHRESRTGVVFGCPGHKGSKRKQQKDQVYTAAQ